MSTKKSLAFKAIHFSNDKYLKNEELNSLKRDLRNKYSASAELYDSQRSRNERVLAFFESSYSTFNSLIGPTSETTIHLDIPVGTGRFCHFLRTQGRIHKILGIDVAPGMLAASKQVCAKDPAMRVGFGDAFQLPLADNSVDLVTSLRFFHLFPKTCWPGLLTEMYRVLRPGGLLITDLRNILRGGVWAPIKEYRDRWLHHDQRHSFIAPYEINRIFVDWVDLRVRGVGLDGALLLTTIFPHLSKDLEASASTSILRYFTKELVVAARKPLS